MGSYVPNSPAVRQQMLEAIGASSIRDLYANVPEEMFLKELDLPAGKSELGDLVFINLPVVGDAVTKEEAFCDVESVKAVSDVVSPLTGVVAEINEALMDEPQMLNESPYEAWIAKVEDITDTEELMDAESYQAFIQQ